MSRYLIVLRSEADRAKARKVLEAAPLKSRFELKAEKRSLDQNAALWAALSDVTIQKEHNGRRYPPDVWKSLFLYGWQKEVQLIPTLDGTGILPLLRTSDLSKAEFSELLDFIHAWGVEQGVKFSGPEAGSEAA